MMVKKADRPKPNRSKSRGSKPGRFFIAAVVLSVSLLLLLLPGEAAAKTRVNVSVSLGGVIIVGGAFIVWSVGFSGRFSKQPAKVKELASADGPYTESKAGFVPLYDSGFNGGYDTGYSRVYDTGYGMGGDGLLAGEEVRVLPKDAVVIDLLRVEF